MLSILPTRLLKLAIYIPVLVLNAFAILNEVRFLQPIGWSYYTRPASSPSPEDGDDVDVGDPTVKRRFIELVHASQFARPPLIFANTCIIIFEILFG
ncbi:Yos1-like protein [Favolaschia claudopus]|uniref:Yos1-like protein n=1 Tax=Favolaschia claudopus TaxID=2862362 RepID=A0AAW0AAC3_9AGAR